MEESKEKRKEEKKDERKEAAGRKEEEKKEVEEEEGRGITGSIVNFPRTLKLLQSQMGSEIAQQERGGYFSFQQY